MAIKMALFQCKVGLSTDRIPSKDEMVIRPYYLYSGNAYIGRTASLYCNGLVVCIMLSVFCLLMVRGAGLILGLCPANERQL